MRRNPERKPKRPIGAMADRHEETHTSYMRVLLKAGITTSETLAPGAWALWLAVNEDKVVNAKKAKLPKIHRRTGFLSRYAETAHVLERMNDVELTQLRIRVQKLPPKFF